MGILIADTTKPIHAAIYIDTSGSMESQMRVLHEGEEPQTISDRIFAGKGYIRKIIWDVAMEIWTSIIDHVSVLPLTLRTIHTRGESQTLHDIGTYSPSVLRNTIFPARNGLTYLWEFLVEEGRELVRETEKWMFILISDGLDNQSSGEFEGAPGFRKCVEELKKLNIDVEFHIVGLDLPPEACDVFRQVSGASGGMFYNLGTNDDDEESLEEIVANLNIAIDEAIDPALRARSRRRRQVEYMETCADGDLQAIDIPSAVPDLEFDQQEVYSRLGITDLNPDEMEVWGESMLSVAGHTDVATISEDVHPWLATTSHSLDPRQDTTLRGTWTLDASQLSQMARNDVDALFRLQNEIRGSFIPTEQKAVVIRGLSVSEPVLNIVQQAGARILILPADLPYPPINWETTRLFLEAEEAPFDETGWSMLPTSINKNSKYAALYDFFCDVDPDEYSNLMNTDTSDWTGELTNLPSDLSRYLQPSAWESISGVSSQLAASLSAQYNGFVRYISTQLSNQTKVFILRPDEDLMKILEQNTHLQVELLNRLDDFLAHNARSKNLPTVTIEYWPTLYNS